MKFSILFSPKPFKGQDAVNQRNALASWRRELPESEIICYGDAEGVAEACHDFRARLIAEIPFTETHAPRFDWIVAHAEREAENDLQMFINADIILRPGFAAAISKIEFPQFLAVSDRMNFPDEAFNGGVGSDYFIYRRGMWKDLPPLAVGRAAYDNALMAYAIKRRIPMVDATPAAYPMHPRHDYGHVAGGRMTTYSGPDVSMNSVIFGNCASPLLCDADYILFTDGLKVNHRFCGFPHRLLIRTQYHYPHNWVLRFFARAIHFSVTRLGIARPRVWKV